MENIVLNKEIIPYEVNTDKIVPFPIKRIKMKNESKVNVDLYVQHHSLQPSIGEIKSDSEVGSVNIESQNQTVSDMGSSTVSDDTRKLYINSYLMFLIYLVINLLDYLILHMLKFMVLVLILQTILRMKWRMILL